MREFDLIIFDCDGVLVDSEVLAMRVLLSTIGRLGITVEPGAAFRDYLGRSLASISESLRDSHGMPLDDDALEGMRRDLYGLYRDELRPSPGIREVLSRLRVPFCVASSSHLERIRVSLELTGLLPLFGDRIFSASMVENGKPAPDLFLHAARQMGVEPSRCLVIEDSPAGIAAAKAAGMTVFAYVGGSHIAPSGVLPAIEALGPGAVFDDMSRLPDLIARGDPLFVGVDVGTGSARAGVLTASGELLGRGEVAIDLRRTDANHAEHDSEQIWRSVCAAVREALAVAAVGPERIAGIAFDATCSLVIRDGEGGPLAISSETEARWDTFVWYDHRAMAEAAECTASGHRILDHLGGVMSPEMQIPKLMWLKRHRPDAWERMGYAFDLSDFLSWKATGSLARSQSTLTSKWSFLVHEEPGWPSDFLHAVGLDDLLERCALSSGATAAGAAVAPLTQNAAAELGLTTACIVGMGMVDAHAGTLSALASVVAAPNVHNHLALIAGTSNSILGLSADPRPMQGIWGPFLGAAVPGLWLSEGGQSAAGGLLDHLIRWHTSAEPDPEIHTRIVARIAELQAAEGDEFAANLHVLADFHGNRSPLADPLAFGVISGLTLDTGFDALCRLYWRTAVALALGLRQILEAFAEGGFGNGTLSTAGGHTRNPLLMQLYADATGYTVLQTKAEDATLLGAAMVAAAAYGVFPSLAEACEGMDRGTIALEPDSTKRPGFEQDYRIMLTMQAQRRALTHRD